MTVTKGDSQEYLAHMSASDVRSEIQRVWAEMSTNESLADKLMQLGLDVETVREMPVEEVYDVSQRGGHWDPGTIAIVVAFLAPGLEKVSKDVWEQIILPRLKRRYGVDAIREKDQNREDREAEGKD